MKLASLISITAMCGLLALAQIAEAQTRSGSNTLAPRPGTTGPSSLAAPTGGQNYPACCSACPAGGCTGCNTPANVDDFNCGSGLIKAKCQLVDDKATCVKDE